MIEKPVGELVNYCNSKPKEVLPLCLERVAILKESPELCDSIKLPTKHDSCLSWFILGKNRWELCSKLMEKGSQTACNLAAIITKLPKEETIEGEEEG